MNAVDEIRDVVVDDDLVVAGAIVVTGDPARIDAPLARITSR